MVDVALQNGAAYYDKIEGPLSWKGRLLMYRVPKLLFIAVSMVILSSFAGVSAVQAQDSSTSLIPVCVDGYFEVPIHVEYLTEEEIREIAEEEDITGEPPGRQITGYPDPKTGSCFTENGELIDYDPESSTPICVPSGPEGDGPLIVRLVSNQFLPGYEDPILADPVTGACPDQAEGDDTDALIEALVEKLREVLREALR